MKICAISDSHNQHDKIKLESGIDILIHGGDLTGRGSTYEVQSFLDWFAKQDARYKVMIAGNHDWLFERHPALAKSMIPSNIIYLEDSGIEIEGIKIYGSPVQPWFYDWAFNRNTEKIKPHWEAIPEDTNILITHGPPYMIGDKTYDNCYTGCESLAKRIKELPNIKYHIFGHIHTNDRYSNYGTYNIDGVKYINAALLNDNYEMVNDPIYFDFHIANP